MDIARSSIKLFVAKFASAAIGFLGITYFARKLGAAPLGVFFLFQALLGILAIASDFGLRGAVEKRISEGDMPQRFLSSAIIIKIIPISIIIIGIISLRTTINSYLGAEVAGLLAVAVFLQEAALLSISVLRGELRIEETAILQFTRQATWVGGGAILVMVGMRAEALIFGLLAGLIITLSWGWYKSSITPTQPSKSHMQSLVDYGKYNVISSIGGQVYSWMDVAIIGLFLVQSQVGAYEVAWKVTALTMLFSEAIATTLFPQISQWDTDGAKERIESVIRESILPSMILVVPAFFGTLIFARKILGFVFGSEFTSAAAVLVILSSEKVLQSVHVVLGRSLQGINRPDLAAWATIISVGLNLILNIALISSFGMVGAAVATTVSFGVNTFLHAYYLSKFVEIEMPYGEIFWCVLSAVGMALLLLGIRSTVSINTLPRLVIAIITGVLSYGLFLLLSSPIRLKVVNNTKRLFTAE